MMMVKESGIQQSTEGNRKSSRKQAVLREKLSGWIMEHPDIRNKYVVLWNRTYNNTRLRQYDGSHLIFLGNVPSNTA